MYSHYFSSYKDKIAKSCRYSGALLFKVLCIRIALCFLRLIDNWCQFNSSSREFEEFSNVLSVMCFRFTA